jgi:hypothetical protein
MMVGFPNFDEFQGWALRDKARMLAVCSANASPVVYALIEEIVEAIDKKKPQEQQMPGMKE